MALGPLIMTTEAWKNKGNIALGFINYLHSKGMSVGSVKPDGSMELVDRKVLAKVLAEWSFSSPFKGPLPK